MPKTHGQAGRHSVNETREYRTWVNMKARCYNPRMNAYEHYGGRGIFVCERWKHSFENFLADMGPKPAGLSLDRKDVNGSYEPDNCSWATPYQQTHNRRP